MINNKKINSKIFPKINLIQILQILILSLFPALIMGPLVAEIILTISIIVYSIYLFKTNLFKETLVFDKFIYFFCFFYIYFLINSYFSDTPSITFIKIFFFFRFIILLIIVNFLITKEINFLKNLSKVVLFIFLILFIDAFIQKFFSFNLLGQKILSPLRISSFFGDELVMGSYISKFAPILLFGTFLFENQKLKKLSFIAYVASLYFILISGERAAIVAYFVSLFYLTVFIKISKTLKFYVLLIIIILGSFSLTFDNKIKTRIIGHFSGQTNHSLVEKNLLLKFIPIQLIEINKTSLEMFDKNKIFGLGPYSYRYYCDKEIQKKICRGGHPHNSYLQLLLETGLIGIFYFLLPFIFVIFNQFKAISKKDKTLDYNLFTISSCLVFLFLWPINQYGNIFNNWLNFSYYLLFSIYISFLRRKI